MILGGLPFLQLDRTGIALLGAIALVGLGRAHARGGGAVDPPADADPAVLVHGGLGADAPGRLLRAGHASRSPSCALSPPVLLAAMIVVVARALRGVQQRHHLPRRSRRCWSMPASRAGSIPCRSCSALACAANVGSAATLIGNPQNMLIGETLQACRSPGYFLEAARAGAARPRSLTWGVIAWQTRGRWRTAGPTAAARAPAGRDAPFDRWQTAKGLRRRRRAARRCSCSRPGRATSRRSPARACC